MNNISYIDLFKYSLFVGVQSIFRGRITQESIKRIICPMDVSRYYELPVVARNLRLKDNSKILDISSPKLITYLLANRFTTSTFYGVDKFSQELKSWNNIVDKPKNLKIEYADATNLKYPSNFFDEIYSISVIEHLGNGTDRSDSIMMKEAYRVLKKGGRLCLTTIASNAGSSIYKNKKYYSKGKKLNKNSFFCRIYDRHDIKARILNVTKFKVIYQEVCNYRYPIYEKIFNIFMPFSILMGWLNLIVAPKLINVTKKTANIKNRAEYFCILEK